MNAVLAADIPLFRGEAETDQAIAPLETALFPDEAFNWPGTNGSLSGKNPAERGGHNP